MLTKELLNGLWQADGAGGGAGNGTPPPGNGTPPSPPPLPAGRGSQSDGTPASFEALMETWTPEVKALYETHTRGLRSALDTERAERSTLAKQMREASGKLEAGSEAQKSLQAIQAKYEALERRQSFTDEAVKPETGCTDARLAYLAALEIGAISEKGKVDWEMLRQQFPSLFRAKGTANAGAGTGSTPPAKFDMDRAIRKAAGRQ